MKVKWISYARHHTKWFVKLFQVFEAMRWYSNGDITLCYQARSDLSLTSLIKVQWSELNERLFLGVVLNLWDFENAKYSQVWNKKKHCCVTSRDSSVGIVLGYKLDNQGSRVRFLSGAGNFSLHHCVQNDSEAHPASYPMGTRGSFPGGKAAGAWSWPLTSI
jgi:hypothetical protein